MGLGKYNIRLLARALKNRNVQGRCLTYGVQGIDGQYEDLQRLLGKEAYSCHPVPADAIRYDASTQFGRTVHQDVLFRMLGYSQVESLDFYPNEQPTHVVDLNQPIPATLENSYDLVYDGGTLEHCFDVRAVLANSIRLLKRGGIIVHDVPACGLLNHGFYQFSPTLFYDFYAINGFDNLRCWIRVTSPFTGTTCYACSPDSFVPFSHGNSRVGVVFSGIKSVEVKEVRIPNQAYYIDTFGSGSDSPTDRGGGLTDALKTQLKKSRYASNLAWHAYQCFKKAMIRRTRL